MQPRAIVDRPISGLQPLRALVRQTPDRQL